MKLLPFLILLTLISSVHMGATFMKYFKNLFGKKEPPNPQRIDGQPRTAEITTLRYGWLQRTIPQRKASPKTIWKTYAFATFTGSQGKDGYMLSMNVSQPYAEIRRIYFMENIFFIITPTNLILEENKGGLLLITVPWKMIQPTYQISPLDILHEGDARPTRGKVLIDGKFYFCAINTLDDELVSVTYDENGATGLPPAQEKRLPGIPLIGKVENDFNILVGLYKDTTPEGLELFTLTSVFPAETVD